MNHVGEMKTRFASIGPDGYVAFTWGLVTLRQSVSRRQSNNWKDPASACPDSAALPLPNPIRLGHGLALPLQGYGDDAEARVTSDLLVQLKHVAGAVD